MADDAQSTVSSSRPPSPSTPTNDTESIAPLPSRRTAPGPYRFHWDPTASKRQGPPSISDATESRADVASIDASIPPPKIESIFDSSLGPSSALPVTWSSSQNGFNGASLYGSSSLALTLTASDWPSDFDGPEQPPLTAERAQIQSRTNLLWTVP